MSGIIVIFIGIILYVFFWLFVYALCKASEENDITDRNV